MRKKHGHSDDDDDLDGFFGDLFDESEVGSFRNGSSSKRPKRKIRPSKILLLAVMVAAILAAILAVTGVRNF
jgi:hypothetical protein